MKNKLTLGLLVFFAGIILVACGGSKGSSSAAEVKTEIPTTFENGNFGCSGDCVQNINGKFYITDEDEYEANIVDDAGSSRTTVQGDGSSGTAVGNAINTLWVNLLDLGTGAAGCELEEAFGYNDCDPDDYTQSASSNDGDTASSYTVNMEFDIEDGDVVAITINLNDSRLTADERIFDFVATASPNVFESPSNNMAIENKSGRLYLFDTSSSLEQIGYIKD